MTTTISFRHLEGTVESLDKTIAYHITSNWTSANTNSITPDFENATTQPDYSAQMDRTGPNKVLINIVSRKKVGIDQGNEPNGDGVHEWVTVITIDVYAEDITTLSLFEDEINRILWTVAPNNYLRLKKSNGTQNSEAEFFEENELEFERITPDEGKIADVPGSQALLAIHWFKDKVIS